MFIGWWACAQKNQSRFLSGNILASATTAVHFALMGSPLGMANQLLNMGRFSCGQFAQCKQGITAILLAIIFCSIAIAQGIWLAEHWSEWCAVLAGVVMSLSLIFLSGTQLKVAFITSNCLNLMLSCYLLSWSGMLYQVVTIIILSYGLINESLIDDLVDDLADDLVDERRPVAA